VSLVENKAVVRRFVDAVFNDHAADALYELVAPDIMNHVTGARGIEPFKNITMMLLTWAPDMRFTVEHMLAEGDDVMVYGTSGGTQTGEMRFRGRIIPPTNRPFSSHHVHIFRVRDGKITEHWAVRDDLGMLQQLGAM